jgi:CheY-like chemotaxis protein
MARQGRILIVDNLETWRVELVEILRRNGFHAESASTVTEALEQLNESIYHVLVADIRLKETDESNIDGIHLLSELERGGLSEAIKVIMLSAYGTIEQMRSAFRDHRVADFLTKDRFSQKVFLESVQRVFSREANINLALDILSQSGSRPEQVVLNLEVGETRIEDGTPILNQMATELEDLLCRLFYQAKGILVRPLTPGQSGTGVVRIQPFYGNRGIGREMIVKFGDFSKIQEEYHNFKEYVEPFIGGGRSTTVLDVRRTTHLGGITYSLLGTNNDPLIDFADFYRRSDISQITDALDRLFLEICGPWYANHENLQLLDLTSDYQRLFGYTAKQLEQIRSRQMKSVRGKQKLYLKSLTNERAFTNPLQVMAGSPLVRPTYLCTTHGDFNPYNLLVDNTGYMWLIDFQETGKSHFLRDVAMLDSAVRFQLLNTEEATLEERLHMEEALCSIDRFSQVEQLAPKLSTENQSLAKAYATIVHLRKLACRLVEHSPSDDISEYYIALFYSALNTLQFFSLPLGLREHALLCASLLADRLEWGS